MLCREHEGGASKEGEEEMEGGGIREGRWDRERDYIISKSLS